MACSSLMHKCVLGARHYLGLLESMRQVVSVKRLNVGCGRDVRPASEGWTNMDAYYEAEGVLPHDLMVLPWPFKTGEFDYVLCSHVMEHIPFVYPVDEKGRHRDVLFAVMEELHRVIKPGGVLDIRVPYGGSHVGWCHPQHYRQWRPEWFNYFAPDNMENYYSSARFTVESWVVERKAQALPHSFRVGASNIPLTSHVAARLPWLHRLLLRPSDLNVILRRV